MAMADAGFKTVDKGEAADVQADDLHIPQATKAAAAARATTSHLHSVTPVGFAIKMDTRQQIVLKDNEKNQRRVLLLEGDHRITSLLTSAMTRMMLTQVTKHQAM